MMPKRRELCDLNAKERFYALALAQQADEERGEPWWVVVLAGIALGGMWMGLAWLVRGAL
jgi:hypothetical protein